MASVFKRLLRDESGAVVVEYAIVCSLIFACLIVAVPYFANAYQDFTTKVGQTISAAMP
ncbi:MAG: Flp family type IVb pilin [Proteobacteria bacterium]|nr:Flp family type IVb pilin [Pseudomonadota bacterium]